MVLVIKSKEKVTIESLYVTLLASKSILLKVILVKYISLKIFKSLNFSIKEVNKNYYIAEKYKLN